MCYLEYSLEKNSKYQQDIGMMRNQKSIAQ